MSIESRIDGIEARMIHADNSTPPGTTVPAFTRPALRPGMRDRQQLALALPRLQQQPMPQNETEIRLREIMKASGIIKINDVEYRTAMKDLRELEELGDGTSGHVVKMHHIPSGAVIAVKQMRRTGNSEENKRIVTDIETALKAHGCAYIVQCLGFIITSADVWICMELMATCFDKLLKRTCRAVPEDILGKVTVAVVKALSFLKDKDTMHRDVKPSNILVDEAGVIKLCDFGISGQLNNSKAKTRAAGCVAYLAPERIDPNRLEYDIRADVWSLGITLVELATGKFPYQDCRTDFEVLTCVMESAPPTLPKDQGFSLEFQNFVKDCLVHDVNSRPRYRDLLLLPFLRCYEAKSVNVSGWLKTAMKSAGLPSHKRDELLQTRNQMTDNGHQKSEFSGAATAVEAAPSSPSLAAAAVAESSRFKSPFPERFAFDLIPPQQPNANNNTRKPHQHHDDAPDKPQHQQQQQYCSAAPPRPNLFDHLQPEGLGDHHSPSHQGFRQAPLHTHHHHQFSGGEPVAAPPELSKVYRKSPFLPRKKASPESNLAPKKESKLSTLGSSFLKNLTTSPFSQRKQIVPQPTELPPPPLHEKHRPPVNVIPGGAHHQTHAQYARPGFHHSPMLQRRNPSYVSYGSDAPSGQQTGSANTSPIVLQRFYHQQNQLRDKLVEEGKQQQPHPQSAANGSMDCHELGLNYSPQAIKKYQTIRSSRHNFDQQQQQRPDLINGSPGTCSWLRTKPTNGEGTSSVTTAATTTTTYLTTVTNHQRLNFGGGHETFEGNAVPSSPMTHSKLRNEDFEDHVPANGKANYEKNLGWFNSIAGDVKKRFASYLKVNLSHDRRLANEAEQQQQHQREHLQHPVVAPSAAPRFAQTNPFLDEADSYSVAPLGDQNSKKLDRRHRSPDPPPRFNRQSPLLLRKKLELSNWGGSPLLSRRLLTGSPPIPVQRRDCESVPGSPQHFRTRIHYTPEPQRRVYRP